MIPFPLSIEYSGLNRLPPQKLSQLTDVGLLQQLADEFVETDTPIVTHIIESPTGPPYRTVTVAGHTCACGGTHVRSTKELQRVMVTRVKSYPKENSCKIFYDVKRA